MTTKSILTKTGLTLALAFVLSTVQSFGQSPIVQDIPFSGLGPDTGLGASTSVGFAAFDSTLGTLTEVDLSLQNVVVTGTVSVTNTNVSGNEVAHNVSLVGSYTVTDNATPTANTVNTGASTTPVTSGAITPGTTYTTPSASSPKAPTQTTILLLGTNDLSSYQVAGGGTINLNLASSNSYSLGVTGGNASETILSTGSGDIVLTYFYTPVPEPAQTSAILMGFGLLLLVGRSVLKKQGNLFA